jgi:hypothetical protein
MYRRKHVRTLAAKGFLRFQSSDRSRTVFGFTDGDYVRLRDEYGTVWSGTAERQQDNSIRYRFRDSDGNIISGVSDSFGVILRDGRGNSWRGFLD